MSHRNLPHIVTHTPERPVEVMLAGPDSLLVMARTPTPPALRVNDADHYRITAWPAFALDSSTAFAEEFLGLRVTVNAVPTSNGQPTSEWLVTMRRDMVQEASAFRLENGQIYWQSEARSAEVARLMTSQVESTA